MNQQSRTCGVCHNVVAKYVCPNCRIAYCSMECYSKHNSECTESFYSRLVFEELSLRQKEDKNANQIKIAEMLKRAQERIVEPLDVTFDCDGEQLEEEWIDSNEEDELLESLSEKLQKGEEVDLHSLPKTLQQAFLRDLTNGELKHDIVTWTPWWLMPEDLHNQQIQQFIKPLIEDADRPPMCSIPCLRLYLKDQRYKDVVLPVTISPTIPYNSLEVVYLYCLCMRLFNGDVEYAKEEIVSSICQYSQVLHKGGVFLSANELVASLLSNEALCQFVGEASEQTKVLHYVFNDVLMILDIPHFVIDALAHCYVLMREVCHTNHVQKELKQMLRKVAFFITVARKIETEQYWLLHQEMEMVLKEYHIAYKHQGEKEKSKNPLIQEL